MLNDDAIINVTNRSRGSLGYSIPDMGNLQRRFEYGETKQLTVGEIRKLNWAPGGHVLIRDFLKIDNEDLIKELLNGVEPEYFYTEDEVKELLINGDMDSFMDCIDFAPAGVLDLMKDLAVKLEIPDVRKRDAISKKTGANITRAIEINKLSQMEDEEPKEDENKQRRVQVSDKKDSAPAGRRTNGIQTVGKYKVVSK